MRDILDMIAFWRQHAGEDCALATLVKKTGSSYRAVGAKKIMTRHGQTSGVLSGGCLEQAIVDTAYARWEEMPFCTTFSTMHDEDRLLGYQAGCAGEIDVLFERLPTHLSDISLYLPFGSDPTADGVYLSLDPDHLAERHFGRCNEKIECASLFEPWRKPVELSVVGCGPGAQVFADAGALLGWQVTCFDYRPAFARDMRGARCLELKDIADALPRGSQAAIVLATHNYQADLTILTQLSNEDIAYLGCLGPSRRFEKLKEDLRTHFHTELSPEWEKCVHAPAGLVQCRTPADIAMTTVAQIHAVLASLHA